MKPTIYLTALAASALVGLDARPSAAQSATPSAPPSVAVATVPAAAPTPWPAHPNGRYELEIVFPDKVLPATLVIADSSGASAAVIQTEGDPEAHAMKITVKSTELFLNTVAENKAVEVVMVRTGDQISGHWTFGEGKGTLRGHVEKK